MREIREKSRQFSKLIVVTGRRRVGKTEWVKHALNDGKDKFVYLLITWQEEKPLCAGLQQEAIRALGRPLPGSIGNFPEAFFAKNPNLRSRQASFAGFSISDMRGERPIMSINQQKQAAKKFAEYWAFNRPGSEKGGCQQYRNMLLDSGKVKKS